MYLDSAWGRGKDFILRRTRHCSVYEGGWNHNFILHRTPITPHTHTAINATNVRSVCPGPIRHPFQIFSERRSMQSSYRHYFSVFGQHSMRIKLWPFIILNINTTCQILAHASNTNVRPVRPWPTRHPFHNSIKQDQRRVVMHCRCNVFERTTR